jgi:ABC-type lipoprotein export system ATPase subunit/ABC-type lipoprotein release transport system permease subunit
MKIKCDNKKYGEQSILTGIDLSFDKYGIVFILGQSGSGKSTLLNIIGMLDSEFEGEISIDEKSIQKVEKILGGYRSKTLGFVFQEYNLIGSLSVKENLMVSIELSGSKYNHEEYTGVMKKLGVIDIENRTVTTLSGGEKQRIAIARALLRGSKIVLADEPTGNLDEKNSENIMEVLKEISKDRLIIVVTHSEHYAQKYGDRIIHIKNTEISSDEDLGYSQNKLLGKLLEDEEQKLKLKPRWYFSFSKKNFLSRKKRIIPIVFSMTIAMLCLSLILGIISGMNNLINDVNKSILESDKVIIKNYSNRLFRTIDNKMIKDVTSSVEYEKMIDYYNTKVDLSSGNKSIESMIKVIDYTEFFRDRIRIIEGRAITQADELLIDKEISELLFEDGNCIGEKIELKTDIGSTHLCTVAGVYDATNNETIKTIYMSKSLNMALSSGSLSSSFLLGYANEDIDKNIMYSIKPFNNSQRIIKNIGFKDSEIPALVNVSGFNYLISKITPQYSPIPLDDISNGKIPEQISDLIFGQEITMQKVDMMVFGKIKIVGICTEKTPNDSLIFYLTEEAINSFNKPQINTIDIYLKDYSNQGREHAIKLFKEKNYTYEMASDRTGTLVMVKMSVISIVLILLTLIVTLLSCLMINFSVKISVMDRTYEVGVLKSLGATNRIIFNIFTFDNILLGAFISILSCTLVGLANIIHLTRLISINGVSIYQFSLWHFIPVIILGCVITVVSGLREAIKISKLSIVEAIRCKNI